MALDTYANFQTAIADHLVRTDLTSQIQDCVTLFESEAVLELFHERRQETTTILVPSNSPAVNVSNAANNGSGLIRLTLTSNSTFTTSQEVTVTGVNGTSEANGKWIITVINDGVSIDLQNSTFTNTYSSGGQVQANLGFCNLPSDYMGWLRVTWTGIPNAPLEYMQPDVFVTEWPNWPLLAVSTPRAFTIEGSILKIAPIDPTPLEFVYYAKTPAITAGLNWLFTFQVQCYWNGVLEQVYNYLHDYQQAGYYGQAKDQNYTEIKMERFREPSNLRTRHDRSGYGATP